VTASVARGTARRTVRVAVVLIAGQAALCAVIGYVTLGGPFLHKSTAARQADPLAAGPIEVPPAVMASAPTSAAPVPPPVSVSPSNKTSRSAGDAGSAAQAEGQRRQAEVPPSLVSAPLGPTSKGLPPQAPTTAPSPSGGNQLATPSASATNIQHNVNVGDPCNPLGADGQTAEGTAVTCLRDVDGTLRWVLA
jgi:hypothetical protein